MDIQENRQALHTYSLAYNNNIPVSLRNRLIFGGKKRRDDYNAMR